MVVVVLMVENGIIEYQYYTKFKYSSNEYVSFSQYFGIGQLGFRA
jgi:hypothetical protein